MVLKPEPMESLKAQLADHGLVLCELVAVADLPDSVWLDKPAFQGGSLLLTGHAGTAFWQAISSAWPQGSDPVDQFSAKVSEQALQAYLPNTSRQCLFPDDHCPVNLMALGRVLGWHSPSPLGMGIHAEYGLWSAYRALWWLDTALKTPENRSDKALPAIANTICAECETQACISACPASALSAQRMPDLSACADYRLSKDSQCHSDCLARQACPVATEHRYTQAQMAYHYDLSRSAIANYRSQTSKQQT
jgi:ferredoxin